MKAQRGIRSVVSAIAAAAMLLGVVAASAAAPVHRKPARPKLVKSLPAVPLGPSGSAFYNPPRKLPAGGPGTLIWARRIQAPRGAIAYKVLYKSKLVSGRTVAVSGLVVAPKGKPPKKGRRVVAWAHGTLGGARDCAPSIPDNPVRNLVDYYTYNDPDFIDVGQPALSQLLKAGDVVTATDYQGLGGPGVHQYTVGRTEANNVVDSVKAAQRLGTTGAGNRVVVLGWSQGGGAAIFAGQQGEAAYAKPLRVIGIAALAPAANNGPDLERQVAPGPVSSMSPSVTAVQQLNVFRGFAAAYPGLNVNAVVTPAGRQVLNALNVECTVHLGDTIQELGVDVGTFFKFPLPAAWTARFAQNTAGQQPTVAPLLTMQGTTDTVVNPNGTTQYIQRACKFHQPVQYSIYPGVNHQVIPFAAQKEYVRWIAARFAGKRAPSNCVT
jgi:alpha-beta hydrolase superfamily lysophospholipase